MYSLTYLDSVSRNIIIPIYVTKVRLTWTRIQTMSLPTVEFLTHPFFFTCHINAITLGVRDTLSMPFNRYCNHWDCFTSFSVIYLLLKIFQVPRFVLCLPATYSLISLIHGRFYAFIVCISYSCREFCGLCFVSPFVIRKTFILYYSLIGAYQVIACLSFLYMFFFVL